MFTIGFSIVIMIITMYEKSHRLGKTFIKHFENVHLHLIVLIMFAKPEFKNVGRSIGVVSSNDHTLLNSGVVRVLLQFHKYFVNKKVDYEHAMMQVLFLLYCRLSP